MSDDDYEYEFWSDRLGGRLDGMGLHPSHHWLRYSEADCFDGVHAPMRCARCGVNPMPGVCFHELRAGDTRSTYVYGKQAGEQIEPAAELPCPDEGAEP